MARRQFVPESLGYLLDMRPTDPRIFEDTGFPVLPTGPESSPLPEPDLVPPELMKPGDVERARELGQLLHGPTQLAMSKDPLGRTKPTFEVGGGRGGGYSRGGQPSVRQAEPEVIPPSRDVSTTTQKLLDWSEPLRQVGYHSTQLKNMSPQEIEAAGRKVVETRLGLMLRPLIELGYTPDQVMRMNPAEAYKAIKGKIISAPTTPAGWLGKLLQGE